MADNDQLESTLPDKPAEPIIPETVIRRLCWQNNEDRKQIRSTLFSQAAIQCANGKPEQGTGPRPPTGISETIAIENIQPLIVSY
jgi:hypothetical protein